MTRDEIKEEIAQDERLEAMREGKHEHRMRTDWDYATTYLATAYDLEDVVDTIKEATKVLNDYGWEVTPQEILDWY